MHNDTTSILFTGQYRAATGRRIHGRRAPRITFGHSKDHRPDLKQLLVVLTTSADGGIPVQFRTADGNTNDSQTHLETWEALRCITGQADFLYIADSKLCSGENMDYIDRRRGRFVTVLPRTRLEDREFRAWIQDHEPEWETVWDRPHPRRRHGPRDIWRVFRAPLPSREGWPVIWVFSSLLALHQEQSRRARIARTIQELERLDGRLSGPRPRLRSQPEIEKQVFRLLRHFKVESYLRVRVESTVESRFVQEKRGRPGPETRYRREARERWHLHWEIDEVRIARDRRSEGMYPLLTNDSSLSPRQVLEAHKRQPVLEKRFEQLKSVHEIAPVFLKTDTRIEAFFFVYFLALLVQTVIEREIRTAMRRQDIESLALYPEERQSRCPTAEQVFRLFSHVEGHRIMKGQRLIDSVQPRLTKLQQQVLELLGVPSGSYRITA
jgi:transposase